jgi:hypothetical protein
VYNQNAVIILLSAGGGVGLRHHADVCVRVCPYQNLSKLTDFHKLWYDRNASPNFIVFLEYRVQINYS